MSPRFIFRIDEICENTNVPPAHNPKGHWEPSSAKQGSLRYPSGTGVTGQFWYCDGQNIGPYQGQQLPIGSMPHHTFSMYYSDGYGFWVLPDDATGEPQWAWRPLTFEHDDQDYSSYLTSAGEHYTLRCQRTDQLWPQMLLPDIYQARPANISQSYGGLKGDLGIFLALIAFSMTREHMQTYLRTLFSRGAWQLHGLPNGRLHKRGVVAYVYTVPNDTTADLKHYESGAWGFYYN